MSSSQSPFHSEHPGGYPSLHSLAPPLQTMTTSLGHGLGAAFGRLSNRLHSRGHRAGRECQRNSATLLGPGPQARYWRPTMNPAERFMVGKEEQGSGVRDTQTWVSRTKRTLRRRGYFPSLESSPPAGGISPKTKQRFRRCGGEFLSERSERNQRIAGGCGFLERPSANASVFHEPLSPGPPFFTGEPEGCVGSCVRRGNLMKGAYAYSLPFFSMNLTVCSYKVQCA